MKEQKVISESKKSFFWTFIIAGIVMIFSGGFLIRNSVSDEYIQIAGLILGGIIFLIGISCLLLIFLIENLQIENQILKITSLSGKLKKEISIDAIQSYIEVEKENKYNTYKNLTIFTRDSKYTISSSIHQNYDSLRRILTKGLKENPFEKEMYDFRLKRRNGMLLLVIGCFLTLIMVNGYLKKDLEILENQLVKIEGTVALPLEIKKSGKTSSSRSIEIELEEYPQFKFKLGEIGLNSTRLNNLISNVQEGDNIEVKILSDQYQKKLTKEISMNFWDKSFNYRIINIYGFKNEQNSYFDLKKFNKNRKADRNSWAMYLLIVLSASLLGYGIYELITNKKPAANQASAFISR